MSWAVSDEEFRARVCAYNQENPTKPSKPNGGKIFQYQAEPQDEVVPPPNGPEDYGVTKTLDSATPATDNNAPLAWVNMSRWDSEPVPERKWAIKDRVPLNQAGLFSGEGGTGKSIIELMKNVAHVTGKDWLGSMPEPGPAIYIGAEDDESEIHIRLAAIAKHYNVTFKELIDGKLHVLCLLGNDVASLRRGIGSGERNGRKYQHHDAVQPGSNLHRADGGHHRNVRQERRATR
jgi:hypothetical protein